MPFFPALAAVCGGRQLLTSADAFASFSQAAARTEMVADLARPGSDVADRATALSRTTRVRTFPRCVHPPPARQPASHCAAQSRIVFSGEKRRGTRTPAR